MKTLKAFTVALFLTMALTAVPARASDTPIVISGGVQSAPSDTPIVISGGVAAQSEDGATEEPGEINGLLSIFFSMWSFIW